MRLLAYLVGRLTRRVLRRWHTTLSSSAATLTALLGLWGGLAVGTWIFTEDYLWAPRLLVCALATAVTVIIITSFVATWLQREPELRVGPGWDLRFPGRTPDCTVAGSLPGGGQA